jgi:hypothetical protein
MLNNGIFIIFRESSNWFSNFFSFLLGNKDIILELVDALTMDKTNLSHWPITLREI